MPNTWTTLLHGLEATLAALSIVDQPSGRRVHDRDRPGHWEQLNSQAPQLIDTRRRYLAQVGISMRPSRVKLIDTTLRQLADYLVEHHTDLTSLAGGQPAALHQLALAAFIDAHRYDRSVRRLRSHYRSRRTRLENCVASQLPDCELTGLSAGLQCILRLPPDTNEKHVERSAAEGAYVWRDSPLSAPREPLGQRHLPW